MEHYERRDVVAMLATFSAAGLIATPKQAKAGGEVANTILLALIVIVVVVATVIYMDNEAFQAKTKSAKLVPDSKAKGGVPASTRARKGAKVGTIRQDGDTLYAELNSRGRKALAGKRSVPASVPLPGKGASVEMTLRKRNKRVSQSLIAKAQLARTAVVVGVLLMDATGLILNMRKARIQED